MAAGARPDPCQAGSSCSAAPASPGGRLEPSSAQVPPSQVCLRWPEVALPALPWAVGPPGSILPPTGSRWESRAVASRAYRWPSSSQPPGASLGCKSWWSVHIWSCVPARPADYHCHRLSPEPCSVPDTLQPRPPVSCVFFFWFSSDVTRASLGPLCVQGWGGDLILIFARRDPGLTLSQEGDRMLVGKRCGLVQPRPRGKGPGCLV